MKIQPTLRTIPLIDVWCTTNYISDQPGRDRAKTGGRTHLKFKKWNSKKTNPVWRCDLSSSIVIFIWHRVIPDTHHPNPPGRLEKRELYERRAYFTKLCVNVFRTFVQWRKPWRSSVPSRSPNLFFIVELIQIQCSLPQPSRGCQPWYWNSLFWKTRNPPLDMI